MTITDLHVGRIVEPMAGETQVWPPLAVASVGTVVADYRGLEWARHRKWWAGPDGARFTSTELARRGPLTVRSVHVCEDWIDSTDLCSPVVTSMCKSCGATKETPL